MVVAVTRIHVTGVANNVSNLFVPFFPPRIPCKWYVVDCLIRVVAVAVVVCVSIDTTVGTTDNAVIATIFVEGKQSIGLFRSLFATVIAIANNIDILIDTTSFLQQDTASLSVEFVSSNIVYLFGLYDTTLRR